MADLKRGCCRNCGDACYIECGHCGEILEYEGEEHTICPKNEDDGFFEEDLIMCDPCFREERQKQKSSVEAPK